MNKLITAVRTAAGQATNAVGALVAAVLAALCVLPDDAKERATAIAQITEALRVYREWAESAHRRIAILLVLAENGYEFSDHPDWVYILKNGSVKTVEANPKAFVRFMNSKGSADRVKVSDWFAKHKSFGDPTVSRKASRGQQVSDGLESTLNKVGSRNLGKADAEIARASIVRLAEVLGLGEVTFS